MNVLMEDDELILINEALVNLAELEDINPPRRRFFNRCSPFTDLSNEKFIKLFRYVQN